MLFSFSYLDLLLLPLCLLRPLGGGEGDLDLLLDLLSSLSLNLSLSLDLDLERDLDLDLERDLECDLDLRPLCCLSASFSSSLSFLALCLALKNSYRPSFSHPSLQQK